jgi:hypothetical protein
MSLSITQTPAVVSLSQSPIIFTVAESTPVYTSSSFQYVGELYYWTGSLTNSGSTSEYTILKYPNTSYVGIFDLNRIINATLTNYAQADSSSVVYYAVDFYFQYVSGSTYVTGSHLKSDTYKALDGYGIFQEPIGQEVYNKTPHWPLMTDGPATQSVLDDNHGEMGVYVGTSGGSVPTKLVYSSSLQTIDYSVSGGTPTTEQIVRFPIGPSSNGFPLSGSVESYTIQAYSGSTALGLPIKFDLVCNEKYPNVRIKWKNRYGQFDYLNFNMIHRNTFSTERRTYQPQLGTWEGSSLSYQNFDTANTAYIVDSKQSVSVNSNWLPESYNEIFKQMMVSDEIYWVERDSSDSIIPLTISTQNITFKTGVNDKLIQYQFDFELGQPYKLIL